MAEVKPALVSLSDHPRAAASIRQVKAWAGLAGFALVGGFSYQHGTPPADCLLRALIAGVLFVFLGWIGALLVWQHLLDAEAATLVRRATERRRMQRESAQRGADQGGS